MKIALVSSLPVPHAYGGMDRLLEGLSAALRERHPTDLVTLPVDERSPEGVLRGYYDFYHLDLSAYDIVISYKAPAYLVQHPVHVLYLSHRLRVFYDLYEPRDPQHARMRRLIHWLDNWAMARERIPEIYCVGAAVSRRLIRWGGIASTPIHHPTTFEPLPARAAEYFFAVGRLHAWKRFDLIIRAYRASEATAPLRIAGSGPDEAALRRLAAGDPRIEWMGHVDEQRLRELYAGAIATIFPPINEDLGMVTFESFLAGKPVLTTDDAGEPADIVENARTGFVTQPTPEALAERINWMDRHRAECVAMMDACHARAGEVTWDRLVDALLAAAERARARHRPGRSILRTPSASTTSASPALRSAPGGQDERIHLLVTDNQMIDPPVGGGRIRIWELYRNLPDDFTTTYLGTHDHPGPLFRDQWMAPNFREIVMPLTMMHFRSHEIWRRLTRGRATIDVTIPLLLGRCSPRYHRLLREHLALADLLIVSHPWMWPYLPPSAVIPRVYDAHNCEAAVKRALLGASVAGRYLSRVVERTERRAVTESDLVLACSETDAAQFAERYGSDAGKILSAPNGVDVHRIRPAAADRKPGLRGELSLPDRPLAVFVGSDYAPNLESADFLIRQAAPALSQLTIGIVGGVGPAWSGLHETTALPKNVHIFGHVDSEELTRIYQAADFGLNPMTQGSGTNIKMLDYMAAGLPIVSTPTGARGLAGVGGEHWAEAGIFEFIDTIRSLSRQPERAAALGEAARKLAESCYDWKRVAADLAVALRDLRARARESIPLADAS